MARELTTMIDLLNEPISSRGGRRFPPMELFSAGLVGTQRRACWPVRRSGERAPSAVVLAAERRSAVRQQISIGLASLARLDGSACGAETHEPAAANSARSESELKSAPLYRDNDRIALEPGRESQIYLF
jgi:hypothetical protein